MEILKTPLEGIMVMQFNSFKDNRGEFVKTISEPLFTDYGLEWRFKESFYSVSDKNVIRGMHFQFSPHEHDKFVHVIQGKILDVVLDLRASSATFGQYFSLELSSQNRTGLYICKGFAHGFLSLSDNAVVEYHTTTVQNKDAEGGLKWDSFSFDWPIARPIISVRDNEFADYNSNTSYFS